MARKVSRENYDTDDYKLFFDSLLYIVQYEEKIYSNLTETQRDDLPKLILDAVKEFESEEIEFGPRGYIDSS